jgi:tRNA pseudouridine55 synthase
MMGGFVLIDKPPGKTSNFVTSKIRRAVTAKKVGHLGTLDPFATGLLVLAVNNGTKLIPYIPAKEKIYQFTVKFGIKTNTGDLTGQVIKTEAYIPSANEIYRILNKYSGQIQQVPHIFSAVKVNGKRSYELARKGEIPQLKPKTINIYKLELKGQCDESTFEFEATVSAGTYIRSLCEDMAESLGTLAHVTALRRTKDGQFLVKNAIPLDEILKKADTIKSVLIPLENVLDGIPVVLLSCQDAENLSLGRKIATELQLDTGTYIAKADGGFLAIVEHDGGVISPKRLIKLK